MINDFGVRGYQPISEFTTCDNLFRSFDTEKKHIKLLRGYSTASLVTKNAFVYCIKLRTFFKVGVLYVYR